jgi:WD40 repeat protein
LAALVAAADEPSPLEARAEAVLQKIEARMKDASSADAPKLRRELLNLRIGYPGTLAAIRAAVDLGKLSSALDRLDAKTIPDLEKFDWQPKELVGILGEHRGRHAGPVASVAVSSDNKYVVSGGGNYVRIWDAATMRLIDLGSLAVVSSVAITKDKKFVVASSSYGSVAVWEFVDGKKLTYKFGIPAATSAVYQVACHPDSKRIAAACFDNVVRMYDISGAAPKDLGLVTGHEKQVYSVAFAADGKTLATGSEDLTARFWDVTGTDYKEKARLENHTAGVVSLAFTPSDRTLATGCTDGTIRFWALPAGSRVKAAKQTHQGPKGSVSAMSYSASGKNLAATCGDNTVRLWGVGTGKPVERAKLVGFADPAIAAAFSPDGKLLATGGTDQVVRTWDMTKAKPTERFVPASHLSHVYSVAFAPDDQTLASGSLDRVVRFWELDRAAPKTRNYLKGDNIAVYAVAYSPDGKHVAAAGNSVKIRQWDAKTGAPRAACAGHPGAVSSMMYSPEGRYLLTSSINEALVFDSPRGSEVQRFGKHKTHVHCIAFSPDGRKALSGSGAILYDKDNKPIIKDGAYVYQDCVLHLWDVDKGDGLAEVKDAKLPFATTAFSADGGHVWAGVSTSAEVRRFALKANVFKEEAPLKGLNGYNYLVLPTADGTRLLTRGSDGKLVVLDIATGKRLYEWAFNEQMGGVAVTTDGRHLAVGLSTGVIYVLRIDPAKKAG